MEHATQSRAKPSAIIQTRSAPAQAALAAAAATGETGFFRTQPIWWYLADEFLPAWHARSVAKAGAGAAARPLRIWCAPSATGEDAYSVAMMCHQFQRRHPSFRFEIDSTDSSEASLEAASAARYGGHGVERFAALRPDLFGRYLEGGPVRFSVVPALRAHVRFSVHDPLQAPRVSGEYDLVLLRDLLNDYDTLDQQRILAQVSRAMRPGAKLVLGGAQSIARLDSPFALEQAHVYHVDAALA